MARLPGDEGDDGDDGNDKGKGLAERNFPLSSGGFGNMGLSTTFVHFLDISIDQEICSLI